MNTEKTQIATNNRIEELDGLRGIAILLVLIWHYITCQYRPGTESNIVVSLIYKPTSVFWSGVDLFFVLSGFLIGGIILSYQKKSNFLKVFWIRRACRIIPPFLLLLLSYIILKQTELANSIPWLFDRAMPTWSYATFTQNVYMGLTGTFGANYMGVTWSLAIEEQFYLFAPLLAMLFGPKHWTRLLLPLALTAVILRILIPGFHTYVNTIFRMDALLMGFFIASVYTNKEQWKFVLAHKTSCLLGLSIILALLAFIAGKFGYYHELKFFWFALLYSSILLCVLMFSGKPVLMPLRSKYLTFWGTIAYGLYLYHQAISGLIHGFVRDGAQPAIDTIVGILCTLAALLFSTTLALYSYKYFEQRFINFGKSVKYK